MLPASDRSNPMGRSHLLAIATAALALCGVLGPAAAISCPDSSLQALLELCAGMQPLFGVNGTDGNDCLIGTGAVRG